MVDYFQNHMSNNCLSIPFQKVHLDWIDPDVFEAILRYIYTGQVFHITNKTYMAKISIQIIMIYRNTCSTSFILIQILESHQKYDENIDLLSGVFLAADMFQMIDLEAAVLQRLSKCCTPNNCLFLFRYWNRIRSMMKISIFCLEYSWQLTCFK